MQPSLLFTTKFSFWEEPVVNSNPTCCKSLRKFTEFLSEVEKGNAKVVTKCLLKDKWKGIPSLHLS